VQAWMEDFGNAFAQELGWWQQHMTSTVAMR
jgi:hypothetical protein